MNISYLLSLDAAAQILDDSIAHQEIDVDFALLDLRRDDLDGGQLAQVGDVGAAAQVRVLFLLIDAHAHNAEGTGSDVSGEAAGVGLNESSKFALKS